MLLLNSKNLLHQHFQCRHAISFPYGRSALWTFLKAMGIKEAEIVQPAYSCSVVAHATILSGNNPVFVDIGLRDYNMELDLLRKAISPNTLTVLPTHLFGYPMDVDSVNQIVHEAEKRFGHRIYVIQDCAHSFEAKWRGKSVVNAGDGAFFGLNISKQITSIFGGMFTTNNDEIASKMQIFRDQHFLEKSWLEKLIRRVYMLAIMASFNDTVYGFTYWLQTNTGLLRQLTDAYHLDQKIHFPPDYLKCLSAVEARVGLEQLNKYQDIKTRRRKIAAQYFDGLKLPDSWIMPPNIKGATYSHFVIRIPDREQVMALSARQGVQLGRLIEYSMPHQSAYQEFVSDYQYPNSLLCSKSMINLPIHPGLSAKEVWKITDTINNLAQ